MTFARGQANLPLDHKIGLRIPNILDTFRTPQYAAQPDEPLNQDQREIDHLMRCTKVGCTRCG